MNVVKGKIPILLSLLLLISSCSSNITRTTSVTGTAAQGGTVITSYPRYELTNNSCTRNGIPGPKAFESLRKFILAGEADKAIDIGFDMYRTSIHWNERLWNALQVIAICDIGPADPYAIAYVYALRCVIGISEEYDPEQGGMQALTLMQAIRYLCQCKHDDSIYAVKAQIDTDYAEGKIAQIPEFAYDMHTRAGQARGQNPYEFLGPEGGSKVVPELPGAADKYKVRLRQILAPQFAGDHPQKFEGFGYNYWGSLKSFNGLPGDLLQSGYQKSIRRNRPDLALKLGYELFVSGGDFESFAWDRLVIMTSEDVGMGEPNSGRLMYTYSKVKDYYPDDRELRLTFLLQAIRFMCGCTKERSNELRKGILTHEYLMGKVPRLADY